MLQGTQLLQSIMSFIASKKKKRSLELISLEFSIPSDTRNGFSCVVKSLARLPKFITLLVLSF